MGLPLSGWWPGLAISACMCTTVLCIVQETTISPIPALAPPNFCCQIISGKAQLLWVFSLYGARVSILWLMLRMQTHLLNPGILDYGSLGCNGLSGQGTVSQEWKIIA